MDLQLQLDLCLRVGVAAILSAWVGYQRQQQHQPAGLRTHMLVGIGSALFTCLSLFAFAPADPGRVAAQIVTGIGFLGAGSIIQNRGGDGRDVHGITTAAGIWTVAAIGMACGTGAYVLAAFVAALTWFILAVLRRVERPTSTVTSTPAPSKES